MVNHIDGELFAVSTVERNKPATFGLIEYETAFFDNSKAKGKPCFIMLKLQDMTKPSIDDVQHFGEKVAETIGFKNLKQDELVRFFSSFGVHVDVKRLFQLGYMSKVTYVMYWGVSEQLPK